MHGDELPTLAFEPSSSSLYPSHSQESLPMSDLEIIRLQQSVYDGTSDSKLTTYLVCSDVCNAACAIDYRLSSPKRSADTN
jgi:hypothetical protein